MRAESCSPQTWELGPGPLSDCGRALMGGQREETEEGLQRHPHLQPPFRGPSPASGLPGAQGRHPRGSGDLVLTHRQSLPQPCFCCSPGAAPPGCLTHFLSVLCHIPSPSPPLLPLARNPTPKPATSRVPPSPTGRAPCSVLHVCPPRHHRQGSPLRGVKREVHLLSFCCVSP